jgi:adenylate cyclase
VDTYERAEAAERTGLTVADLDRLVELAIVQPDAEGRFSSANLRRASLVRSLMDAGIPMEGLGEAVRSGQVSLAFIDAPAFERFSVLGGETFRQLADRSGVPVELLMFIREASGSVAPVEDDRAREDELPFVELIGLATSGGFSTSAIQQLIRVHADSLRRVAETESAVWQSQVIEPATRAGLRPDEILGVDFGDRMSALSERSVVAMYHLQQTRAWGANIIEGLEAMLADVGLHTRVDHPPAMCFLDITGYTRLTQEHGDVAAADLAERLGRIVQRTSIRHGGRAVKWLGDGVMLHFPIPGAGVVAALEMVVGVTDAGLPPAHVGLHAGPVIFQEGDYYGQTVNLAARIADHAQPGEVLVSQAVVDACIGAPVTFRDIGPVELKGVHGATRLHAADRA